MKMQNMGRCGLNKYTIWTEQILLEENVKYYFLYLNSALNFRKICFFFYLMYEKFYKNNSI